MRNALLLGLLAATLAGCGFQNPFDRDENVAGESSPAEDSIAISNYVAAADNPDMNITAGGDVFIASDGGSIVYRVNPAEPAPATEPEPEAPVAP